MISLTKKEMAKILDMLMALYPNIQIKEGTVEAWHEMIGHVSAAEAAEAFKKVVSAQQFPGLPAVGKILLECKTKIQPIGPVQIIKKVW